jgi:hypothetical protein
VSEPQDARGRVAELLEASLVGDAATLDEARVLDPIPVAEPGGGGFHAWFVPVAVGDELAGFAELGPDLEFVRYSSFPHRPRVRDWTDPETIRGRAADIGRPGERFGEPMLTYDREPSRLAWAVRATDPAGRSRTIYVSGNFVYEERPQPSEPEVGGAPAA